MRTITRAVLALVVALAFVAPVLAEEVDIKAFEEEAARIEKALESDRLPTRLLERYSAEIEAKRAGLSHEATEAAKALAPVEDQLEALGPAPDEGAEPPEIANRRTELNAELAKAQAKRKRADEALARADVLIGRLTELRRERFAAQLMERAPSPVSWGALRGTLNSLDRQRNAVTIELDARLARIDLRDSLDRLALPVIASVLAVLFAAVMAVWVIRRIRLLAQADGASITRKAVHALTLLVARVLPFVLGVGLLVLLAHQTELVGPTGEVYLRALFYGVLVFCGTYLLAGVYFMPERAAVRLSALDDHAAAVAHRWSVILAMVVALDRFFVIAGREAGLSFEALAVLNAGLLVFGGVALARMVRAVGIGTVDAAEPTPAGEETDAETPQPSDVGLAAARALRIALQIIAVAAPVLALVGFFAASRYLFYPAVFSTALIGFVVLAQRGVREITQIASRRDDAEAEADAQSAVPAVLPVITGFLLFLAAVPMLALIWGATVADLGAAWSRLVDGVSIGDVTIVPLDFLMLVIVFSIGYLLTRLAKSLLERSVLPVTRLDAGAKSAILAGVGYVGVVLSALIAISTTGLDLSNLAIVAGALSVGIGFGLQNIVNNFVSGIILLIERPIKTGDWVEIGGTHGTVKKVNVRSTEIQTFDRSTMFVPNADLISGTVTNWTGPNRLGRLIVPVGVAYGSDARKVEKILLEIAQGHPMLMRRPAPYVLFAGFGADSLDFEIRGVLRDVNWILNVQSDVRFSIYERFEAEGIEIPFAQRDLHIRSLGGLDKLVGQRPTGAMEEDFDADSDSDPPGGDAPG